jgi:hypothetical protein
LLLVSCINDFARYYPERTMLIDIKGAQKNKKNFKKKSEEFSGYAPGS